jgi:hypothetical protein
MALPQFQTQRLELKYRINQSLAVQVRDFVAPYLVQDPFGAAQTDLSYPVHSLYLDSPDYFTYQSTINGNRNRFKLRIRFYEGLPHKPVYCEIKRREDSAIYKQRCGMTRHAVAEVVAGRIPARSELVDDDPSAERALHSFSRLVSELNARPVCHVSYRREAWLGHDGNRVRVTFDRMVRTCQERRLHLEPELLDPVVVFDDEVVLELKFTGRFPVWMRDLVQVFGLSQTSAAKYCDGLDCLRGHPLKPMMPDDNGQRQLGHGLVQPGAGRASVATTLR